MTTSTPPRAGVLRGAYKRASTGGPGTIPPTMPGTTPAGPPPSIDALDPSVASPPLEAGQTLLHLGLPGQNMAPFATAVQALSGVWQPPKRGGFWGWGRPAKDAEITALELVGKLHRVTFGVRGPAHLVQRIFTQLVACYRQVEPELIDPNAPSGDDPLLLQPGEAASWTELHLDKDAAIPLLTPDPRDFAQGADPLRGVLEKLAATPDPLRVVSQIVLKGAPDRFEQKARTRLEAAERHRRQAFSARPSGLGSGWGPLCLLGMLLLGLLALWLEIEGRFSLFILLVELGGPLLVAGGLGALWSAGRRSLQLQQWAGHEVFIADKLREPVVQTCIRLYAIGPASTTQLREQVLRDLADLIASMTAGSNRLVVQKTKQIGPVHVGSPYPGQADHAAMRSLSEAFHPRSRWERLLLWMGGDRRRPILSRPELATLYHFPETRNDQPHLNLQTSQQRLASADTFLIPPALLPPVAQVSLADPASWSPEARKALGGTFAGFSAYAGHAYPVRFPTSMFDGHVCIVAGTGSGKSALVQHILRWAMDEPNTAIFVFDPHSDLANAMAGLVSKADSTSGRVIVVDPADTRPVGFPTLWDPSSEATLTHYQTVISNIVATMERLSDGAWGQRVRSNFYYVLTTLVKASMADKAAQRAVFTHTLMDVYSLCTFPVYRANLLLRLDPDDAQDLDLQNMWVNHAGGFTTSQWLQEVGSVLNRIVPHREGVGGYLLGQREPKWNLREAIQKKRISLVSLGGVGIDQRRSLGSLILSYLQSVLLEQLAIPYQDRPRVLVAVDELQAFDPHALSGLFGEVRKFGGRIIVATNSLRKIEREGPELAAELYGNISTWIVGNMGDEEEGEQLLKRIQGTSKGPLTLSDLLNLPQRHFYVRAKVNGTPQPLFRLIAPGYAQTNETVFKNTLTKSRELYGRERAEVQKEIFPNPREEEVTLLARALTRTRRQYEQKRREQKNTGARPAAADQAPGPDPLQAENEAARVVRQNVRIVEEENAPAAGPAPSKVREQGQDTPGTGKTHPRKKKTAAPKGPTRFEDGQGKGEAS